MLTPNAEQAEVPERKVTEYLLALGSEEGHGKAVFFLSRGFSTEQWEALASALRQHILNNSVASQRSTAWGTRYVVDGPLQCPDGGVAAVRSVWNIKPPAAHPRLVTAHPLPATPRP
jgi:hypothetical protein